jgi:hypothetical protein
MRQAVVSEERAPTEVE